MCLTHSNCSKIVKKNYRSQAKRWLNWLKFDPEFYARKPLLLILLQWFLWPYLSTGMHTECVCTLTHTDANIVVYGNQKWQVPDFVAKSGASDFSICWLWVYFPIPKHELCPPMSQTLESVWDSALREMGWGWRRDQHVGEQAVYSFLKFASWLSFPHLWAAHKLSGRLS